MKDERTPKNTFEWAERIGKNPLYLTGISLSDLGDLLAYVRHEKLEAEILCGLANPPLDPKRNSRNWQEADFVEWAVLDEFKRRNVMQSEEAPQSTKATISEPLPTLEDVVKDADTFLPRLWEALAETSKPLVSRSGEIMPDRAKPSVLMALAQALLKESIINNKFTQVEVYRMLCQYFSVKPAKRPRKEGPTGTGFTNAYSDNLTEFDYLLKGL